MNIIEPRPETIDPRKVKLYMKNPGRSNEDVFICNPAVIWRNRKGFAITSLFNGVLKTPAQNFTASSIWRPAQAGKYNQIFLDLEEEQKILKIGILDKDCVTIKISEKGEKILQDLQLKYNWR